MNRYLATSLTIALAGQVAAQPPVSEQFDPGMPPDVEVLGHILKPQTLEPTPERLVQLSLPPGFEISVFASDLIHPRMLAVADDGALYVTRPNVGDVLRIVDEDGDGSADSQAVVANRPQVHGIAIDGQRIYLATVKELYSATIGADGSVSELQLLVDDLPDGGQHPNRTIAVGPDGKLYVSVGSTCNACSETNPENATMLQVEPDGSSRKIFASGLRNTIGFAFEPESGQLYGMDHGIDWLGDNEQHEELNRIVAGADYGWPYLYDDDKANPADKPPGGLSWQDWAERSNEPVGYYTPHAAPMQLAFYNATQFPETYRGDAFVVMRGSWNRKPPSGYEILRIDFEGGQPIAFHAFASGFLTQEDGAWGQLGRLAGIAQASDGALFVSDDENGVIYRIAYTGEIDDDEQAPTPTNPEGANIRIDDHLTPGAPPRASSSLLIELVGAANAPTIELSSPAFEAGGELPSQYAAEKENISPPLHWSTGPEGTESFVLVMEDPDAASPTPFVHWIVYNIPADVTDLPKAIPQRPILEKPADALQGANDRGAIGYFGPRPPKQDPPHTYHFQVFALDVPLQLNVGATREELAAAMQGHVLAAGTLRARYDRVHGGHKGSHKGGGHGDRSNKGRPR